MATLTLKNIPEPLHEALKASAATHRRSLNREAIECLERSLLGKPLDSAAFLERVRRLRGQTPGRLTQGLLREARRSGRP